jgi:gas vesicle protein
MRMLMTTVGIVAALSLAPMPSARALAQDTAKEDAKKAGQNAKEAGKDAGEAAKDAGKATAEGAKEVGKATGQAGKEVGKASKDAAKGVKNEVKGKTITAQCADGTLQKGTSTATACHDHGGAAAKK